MRGKLWVGAIIATIASAEPARAVELDVGQQRARLDFTTTTIGAWHLDNDNSELCDDDYGEVQERLNLNGSMGAWQLGFRFDGSLYFHTPPTDSCDLSSRLENRFTPEKLWVGWTGRSLEATLGDTYVQFGRGLTLSLRKVDELGVDTTLRGAKTIVRSALVEATLVAGITNPANVDEATGANISDFNDAIGGAQVQFRAGGASIGGQGAAILFKGPPSGMGGDYEELWINAGPSIDAPRLLPNLGLYLEGVAQHRRPAAPGMPSETGYGLYGTATIYAGPATILLEGKAYGDLRIPQPSPLPSQFQAVQYTSPPTAERVLQVIENPQRETAGGRIRFDWRFSSSLLAYVNYGFFRDYIGFQNPDPMDSAFRDATIHDPYAGLESYWSGARSRLFLSGGLHQVIVDDSNKVVRGDLHFDLDMVQPLSRDLSLEIHGNHIERVKRTPLPDPFGTKHFREGSLQLGLSWRSTLAAAFVLDYSTEHSGGVQKDIFPSGTITWDITQASSIRVYAGSSRGGLKCVSGVCRTFPPFDGFKLTATFRF